MVTSSACAATSGSWYSPYDGATWTAASDVDIDHVVPLSEAWRSRASNWTNANRKSFANDLTRPQFLTRQEAKPQVAAAFSPIELAGFRMLGIRQVMRLDIVPATS